MIVNEMNMFNSSTSKVARECEIVFLEKRQTVADVKFIYKLINGKIDCPELLVKTLWKIPTFVARVSVSLH